MQRPRPTERDALVEQSAEAILLALCKWFYANYRELDRPFTVPGGMRPFALQAVNRANIAVPRTWVVNDAFGKLYDSERLIHVTGKNSYRIPLEILKQAIADHPESFVSLPLLMQLRELLTSEALAEFVGKSEPYLVDSMRELLRASLHQIDELRVRI